MAREGYFFSLPFIIIAFILFYMFQKYPSMNFIYLGVIAFMLACMFVLFFRDPERRIPEGDDLIVSPADGRIVDLTKSSDRTTISIFLSIFNVHVNRIPVSGIVKRLVYRPGKFKAAFRSSASNLNERFEIEIKTDKGNVIMHQIAGVLARRVVCRLEVNQVVNKGDRFGLIRFGSRVDLFLPASAKVEVKMGQRIKGGKTIIGRWA